MNDTTPVRGGRLAPSVSLAARILLGGLFIFAAVTKLGDPQAFAFAIKGFKLVPDDTGAPLIIMLAFVIPWTELIAGALLVLGLWTRPAAVLIGVQLVAYTVGVLSVIARPEISADCSCFGDTKLVCGATTGWCQVVRNIVLLGVTAAAMVVGGSRVSLDRALARSGRAS